MLCCLLIFSDICCRCLFTVSKNVFAARGSVVGIFIPASSHNDLITMNVSGISNIMDTGM